MPAKSLHQCYSDRHDQDSENSAYRESPHDIATVVQVIGLGNGHSPMRTALCGSRTRPRAISERSIFYQCVGAV